LKRAAPIAVAGVASALLWLLVMTRPHNPTYEESRPPAVYDFFSYYRPNAAWAFERMRRGELPLWNPYQGFGQPFLATLQTGVLYPPNALHLLLATQPAFTGLAFLHLGLAAAFAAGLARALGAGSLGAGLAGLLYAGSLQLWGSAWTPPTLYTAAWAPGVLLAVERAVERPSALRTAALAGALAMQALAGWPYAVAMTGLAASATGAAALARRWLRFRRAPLGAALALALGASAGALLAAPQLLPAYELMARSARSLGTLEQDPAQAIGSIPAHEPAFFARTLASEGISDGVPGLAAPLLALAAVVLSGPGRGRAGALLAVGLIALAASFPRHTPVYGWLRHLPVLGDFRFPFRYRLLTTLALAVCAGVGFSRIGRAVPAGQGWPPGARLALATGLALAAVAVEALPLARVAGTAATAFPREEPAPSSARLEHDEQIAALRRPEARAFRSYWRSFGDDKLGQRAGIRVTQDLEPLSLSTTGRFMSFLATGDAGADPRRPEGVRVTLGAPYSGSIALPAARGRAPLLDVASVRYAAGERLPAWIARDWRLVGAVGSRPPLYENPSALPRARRAARAIAEPADPQAALELLVDPAFDAGAVVLLDPLPREAASLAAGPDPSAETRIEIDEPERVAIRTRGAVPAVLVLADACFPGWEATLDGSPAALEVADTAFRAVVVPGGEHVVEMRYRPRSLRVGVALALLAASGLALAVARERRRARRG